MIKKLSSFFLSLLFAVTMLLASVGSSIGYAFDSSSIPEYNGAAYTAVNGNVPYFSQSELSSSSFERYSYLDGLGRCGVATASVGLDLMPTEERGPIGMVKPTGWHTVKYDCVSGKYLYNRCHLIGFQLSGENANERNLITGTRYLNIEGMLPFENMVADYVHETGNHVMYRVTPIFKGSNPLAHGVLMEGWSVEDNGAGICFCVFAHNVQPGVAIDYTTGESWLSGSSAVNQPQYRQSSQVSGNYIVNRNTRKFHKPNCSSVKRMKESNKIHYNGSREKLIDNGFEPCGNCRP